jgi:two-component system chemotaxis response regulator CheY
MKPARVLIVDDSSVMRKIVGRSLRQAGLDVLQVLEASNGSEALTLARDNPLDLILSDINMPQMDGLEFVRQLRTIESAHETPVVMITTEAGEAHVVQALSLGASGYIRKPFTPEQIKERIIPLLRG